MQSARNFMCDVLGHGLELGVVTADDLIREIGPELLAFHLPVLLKTKLLKAALGAEKMDARLILEAIGIEGLAEHAPLTRLWAVASVCAKRGFSGEAAAKPNAKAEKAGAAESDPKEKAEEPEPESEPEVAADSGDAGKNGSRKPNRSARPRRRAGAGATSLRNAPAPKVDSSSVYDADTRVGADAEPVSDYDVVEETDVFGPDRSGEATSPGKR